MQEIYDIKLFTFNIKSHSNIDIILDSHTAILLCFFKEEKDFKNIFYKISTASVKFQVLHLIFEGFENYKLFYLILKDNIIPSRFIDFFENPMKSLYRTFIAYSSILPNEINFYLSCGAKETSEIISSLTQKSEPNFRLDKLKKILISEKTSKFFQLLLDFPYLNLFHLVKLCDCFEEDAKKIKDIINMEPKQITILLNRILESNSQEYTFCCVNYFLKFVKALKLI